MQLQANQIFVQRFFTSKFACFGIINPTTNRICCNVAYKERLIALGIYSLERRRERFMIIQLHKIILKMIPSCGLDYYYTRTGWLFRPKWILSRNVPAWIRKARNSSFFVNAPRLYNRLPSELRQREVNDNPSSNNVIAFKRRLDKFLLTIVDDPGTQANSLLEFVVQNQQ